MPDISVQNEGNIFLLHPLTDAGTEWIEENISEEAQMFGTAVVVEHGCVRAVVEGMVNDGLEVE